jgi:hypothetical protein
MFRTAGSRTFLLISHYMCVKLCLYRTFARNSSHVCINMLLYSTRLSLWSSGQSSWLQIQRPGFDYRRYQIFWEVMGLERGPLGLMSTTEELLWRKSSGSSLESREYGRRDPLHWPRDTLHPQTLTLTSPTSGGRSVGTVRSRNKATEFVCFVYLRNIKFSETFKYKTCPQVNGYHYTDRFFIIFLNFMARTGNKIRDILLKYNLNHFPGLLIGIL